MTSYGYGQLVIYGKVSKLDGGPLPGVSVTIVTNGKQVASTTTNSSGKYTIEFNVGSTYKIQYNFPGYVGKFIEADVRKVNEEDIPAGGRIFPAIDIDLFKNSTEADFSFLKTEPVVKWTSKIDRMDFDAGYVNRMKKKIQDQLDLIKDNQGNDAEYNALIQEADRLFNKKEYEAAMAQYVAAIKLPGKQAEVHPNNRIVEIGDILQKKAEDELAFNQDNQEYVNLIEAADNFAKAKQYEKAIFKYEEAIDVKSDEQYPKDRVVELEEIMANAGKQSKYDELIKLADMFYKQKSLETARDNYQAALDVFPNEQYPKDQLAKLNPEIEKLLDQKSQKDNYNKAVEAADAFYKEENWEEAIEKYNEALTFESAATYPVERIKMAEEKWDAEKAEKEKAENFERLVAEADAHVGVTEYEEAVGKYNEALTLFDEAEVKTKRDNAQGLLAEQNAKAEKQAAFDLLVQEGDDAVETEAYSNAIQKYEEALTLFEDAEVATKRDQAQQLLNEKLAQSEKQEEFDALVQAGDDQFNASEFEKAIAKYDAALSLFSDDDVIAKKKEAQDLLESKNAEKVKKEKIEQLLASAKDQMNQEKYPGAIEDYVAVIDLIGDASSGVMGVDDDYQTAKEGKEEAERLLQEQLDSQANQEQFNQLVKEGDDKVAEKKYESAIAKYESALGIKEDQEVKDKRDQAQQQLEEQKDNAQKEEEIAGLMASAEEKMGNKEYEKAITDYTSVLDLDVQFAKAIEGKAEAERLLGNQEENAQKEAQFEGLVSEADVAFNEEDWEDAKTKYLAAKAIFADREHVNNRISEINSILEGIKGAQEKIAQIQTLLDQAANLKPENKWGQVVQKYEEALALDNERADVSQLLEEAKGKKAEWELEQSQGEKFAQLKQDGEILMAEKKWENAKTKFEEALEIEEDNEIRAFLESIAQEIVKEAAAQETTLAYKAKMDEAEELATAKKYDAAIVKFQEALTIKENDVVAESRIADLRQLIEQLANASEMDQRYIAAMTEGRDAIATKDFSAAIKAFDDALIEKPGDSEATRLKNEAKEKIDALKAEETQFNSLLEKGQALFEQAVIAKNDIPTLKEAKEKFKEAQTMRPDASQPQAKIVEIDELIRQTSESQGAAELAEIERKYQEQIELADAAAQNEQYENAIVHLEKALTIKDGESYPKEKIIAYKAILAKSSAKEKVEQQYADLISKANQAFDNKNYQNSIDFYQQAQEVKKEETYPATQIEKAKKAILDSESASIEQTYQRFRDKADTYFGKKEYENALAAYKEALGVKANDNYAKDKIDETNQILLNLKEKELANDAINRQFQLIIKEADTWFDKEDYMEAKKAYDKALEIKENDAYAIERARLSVVKSKEKTEKEDELLYRKILSKADNYFGMEDFDKAIELYERAIKLRSNDQYPKDKIEEIEAIRNAHVKEVAGVEYLGTKTDISIREGAALLEQGARMREQIKRTGVEGELKKNEGIAEDKTQQDFTERQAYDGVVRDVLDRKDQLYVEEQDQHRNFIKEVKTQEESFEGLQDDKISLDLTERHAYDKEVVDILDRKDNIYIEESNEHRAFIDRIIEDEESIERRRHQLNNFEEGDVARAYKDLVYIENDYDDHKLGLEDEHIDIVERVKAIEEAKEYQAEAELAKHKVGVVATRDELLKTEKANENLYEVNKEVQKGLAIGVDDINRRTELRTFEESNDLYKDIMQLESDALLAEIKSAESVQDKSLVTEALRDEIYALDAEIQRKNRAETDQTYQSQLTIDKKLTASENQYELSKEGKDDERQQAVEKLKRMDQDEVLQLKSRADKQYEETQSAVSEITHIQNLEDLQADQQQEDLAKINKQVKAQEEGFDRDRQLKNEEDSQVRHQLIDGLKSVTIAEEQSKLNKGGTAEENYENVKGIDVRTESHGDEQDNLKRKSNVKTQKLLDQLESNSITFSPLIANTIGDEYPEGVSQENYVRKDKDGIPVKIVTRRFVVAEGHGDIFMRIQTRNGITYSKNGTPITEQGWINGTENAKFKKNY